MPKEQRQNILLVTADQFHPDFMGFLDRYPVATPNLDELALRAAVHHQAYSVNPLCMPARCSLLTGLYSHQHGIRDNRGDLDSRTATVPAALRRRGYHTPMIGKIHFWEGIPSRLNYRRCYGEVERLGFDEAWVTAGKTMVRHVEDEFTAHLLSRGLLDRYRADAAAREVGPSGPTASPTVLAEEDTRDWLTCERGQDYLRSRASANDGRPFFLWLSYCNPHPSFDPLPETLEHYADAVFPLPPSPSPQLEASQFQQTARSYAAHPTLIPAGDYRQPIEITDTAATFLELAGSRDLQADLPESPSRSLFALWSHPSVGDDEPSEPQGRPLWRDCAFYESGPQFYAPYKALCDGRWKYVNYDFTGTEELFDLQIGAPESRNLAPDEPVRLASMRAKLLRRLGATPAPVPPFWVHDAVTGDPSPQWHHGPAVRNAALDFGQT